MKIIFTQAEVKAIVLDHVWQTFPQARLNTVELDKYAHLEYMTVSYEALEAPVEVAEVHNEL